VGGETHRAETRLKKGDTAMTQKTTSQASSSSPIWERLEAFVREQVQRLIQALLEEESTVLLGRPAGAVWMRPRACAMAMANPGG
jgi:hypothetical protein